MFCSHPEHSILHEKYDNVLKLLSHLDLIVHTEIDWLVLYNNILDDYFARINAIIQSIPEALIKSDCGISIVELVTVRTEELNTASFWNKIRWNGHYDD